MTDFRNRSKNALRNLSEAAEWMVRRNVGSDHWWCSTVLTDQNTDPDKTRPKFDASTAQEVFDELIKRGLLVESKVDATGKAEYVMNYDLDGWDKAVADGRWLRGKWLTIIRSWTIIVFVFLSTCVVTTLENRVVGVIDRCIDAFVPAKVERGPNGEPKGSAKVDDAQEQQNEPNKAVNPSGGSGAIK